MARLPILTAILGCKVAFLPVSSTFGSFFQDPQGVGQGGRACVRAVGKVEASIFISRRES